MAGAVDLPAVHGDLVAMSERVAALVRSAPDGSAPVRGLDWTVSELAAHLVGVLDWQAWSQGDVDATQPGALDRYTGDHLSRYRQRDLEALAAGIERLGAAAPGSFGNDPERRFVAFGVERTAASYAAVLLGELLVHGLDLARTLGQPWTISPAQAANVLYGSVEVLPLIADETVAAGIDGTLEVRLRGGRRLAVEVARGDVRAWVADEPVAAGLRMSADPVAYLLVGYGRLAEWRALATGRIVAWGRRPWLALAFRRLFRAI